MNGLPMWLRACVWGLGAAVVWPVVQLPREQRHVEKAIDYLARLEMAGPLTKKQIQLPTVAKATALVQQLPALIREHHLGRTGISYILDEKAGAFQRLRFTLSLEGTYADLRRFLFAIETNPQMLIIDQLSLRKSGHAQMMAEVILTTNIQGGD